MASWQTCLTMRAKQSCWAAGRAQYFIRLQSLNRQLSTDHVIRTHQRDSIDSVVSSCQACSMIGSSRFRSLNHHGGLTFHYRRIFYDNRSMGWSGQQINGWQLFSTLCWWKLQVYPSYTVWQWSVVCSCQGFSFDFKLACLLYFLFPGNVGLGY